MRKNVKIQIILKHEAIKDHNKVAKLILIEL